MEPLIDVFQIFLSGSNIVYVSVADFRQDTLIKLMEKKKNKPIKIKLIQLTVSAYEKVKFYR